MLNIALPPFKCAVCRLHTQQENGSAHLLLILCEAWTLHYSTVADPAMRKVQLYVSVAATTCITALMVGILNLHLMSKDTECDMDHPTHTLTQV